MCHAPIQHCIICSRSTNTEQQERHFNTFVSISLSTLSRRPGEIITPGLIRMQAEMKQADINRSTIQEQESRLGKLSKRLPKAEIPLVVYPDLFHVKEHSHGVSRLIPRERAFFLLYKIHFQTHGLLKMKFWKAKNTHNSFVKCELFF